MKKKELPESTNLYDQPPADQHKEPIGKKIALGIAAAVLIGALGLFIPTLLEVVAPPSETQSAAASHAPQAVQASDSQLTVTVYADEWKETALQPSVSVVLNEYSPTQSDVPGLPFIITAGDEGILKDGIRVDVDAGSLITWAPPDYTVRDRGKTYVLSSGDTIYWSPLNTQGAAQSRCVMTVTAYDSENEAYSAAVVISQTKQLSYTAELQ